MASFAAYLKANEVQRKVIYAANIRKLLQGSVFKHVHACKHDRVELSVYEQESFHARNLAVARWLKPKGNTSLDIVHK